MESFFRSLFRLVTQRREAQKRPWRRSHASLTSDLEHSKVFLLVFSYVHVFYRMPLNEKQAAYWKSRKFIPFCFSNFWSSSNHKWRRQQQWHLTKGFKVHARLRLQKKESTDQKFKVLRTQTFSHVIGCNIKFKTRAYEKIKTTEGFRSSLAFIFCTLFFFVRKETRKVMIKNSRIWDGTQNVRVQILIS